MGWNDREEARYAVEKKLIRDPIHTILILSSV